MSRCRPKFNLITLEYDYKPSLTQKYVGFIRSRAHYVYKGRRHVYKDDETGYGEWLMGGFKWTEEKEAKNGDVALL